MPTLNFKDTKGNEFSIIIFHFTVIKSYLVNLLRDWYKKKLLLVCNLTHTCYSKEVKWSLSCDSKGDHLPHSGLDLFSGVHLAGIQPMQRSNERLFCVVFYYATKKNCIYFQRIFWSKGTEKRKCWISSKLCHGPFTHFIIWKAWAIPWIVVPLLQGFDYTVGLFYRYMILMLNW